MAATRLRRMLIIFGGIILSGLTALPAVLLTPASATPPSAGMNESVSIKLRGRVMPRCALTGAEAETATFDIQSGRSQMRRSWEITCNAPFIVGLISANGGLHLGGSQEVLPYEVNLTILTDSGRTISIDCTPADFRSKAAGCSGTSGDDTAIGKEILLTVKWAAPRSASAGVYRDDFRVSFATRD